MIMLSLCGTVYADIVNSEQTFKDIRQTIINYSQDMGLSQVTVLALEQDQLGFIWVGTQGGLNRFDGKEFKQFTAKALDKNELAGNYITDLCDDGSNNLWIATRTGLSVYNYHSGKFSSYLSHYSPEILNDDVVSLSCDKDLVWVGTAGGGVYSVSYVERKITTYKQSFGLHIVEMAYTDNAVYLATRKGLYKQFKTKPTLIELIKDSVQSIELVGNEVFVGRVDGWLDSYIIKNELFERRLHTKVLPYSDYGISTILSHNDVFWIGTKNGVFVLNNAGEVVESYTNNPLNPKSLNEEIILSLLIDNRGNTWVGTESTGISFLNNKSKQLGHINKHSYLNAPLSHDDVRGFTLDNLNRLWINTSRGIYIYFEDGFRKAEALYPKLKFLKEAFITKVLIDNTHIWITTLGQGVVHFNVESNKFTQFWPDNENAASSQYDAVVKYNNQIIFSSRGYGLDAYDENSNTLQPYLGEFENMPSNPIDLIVVDDSLWFSSSSDGVFRYQDNILNKKSVHDGLLSNFSISIDVDNLENIWVSSDAGINIFDKNFNLLKTIIKKDGLPSDAIWTIVFDGLNSIWAGSSNGLSKIDVNNYSIVNFNKLDGVQDFEYHFGSSWLSPQGKVFIGGVNGFNQFFPENVTKDAYVPPFYLTELTILGEKVNLNQRAENISELPEQLSQLILDSHQDIVSFKFTSLDYSGQKLKYFYRVLGLSEQWLPMDRDSREIHLIKLPPGDYTLESYSINSVGKKSVIFQLPITLHAPFWWSPVSKTFYGFLIILCIFIIWRIRQKVYHNVLKANEVMSKVQQRLQLSLWASGDELWDWNLDDNTVHRHTVVSKINYGTEKESIIRDKLGAFVHPDDQADYKRILEQSITQGEDSFEIAVRVKDSLNNWCWVLDKGRVVKRNEQGVATRIAGAFKDINNLKNYEHSLKALNEDLEFKVAERTKELFTKNQKVEVALSKLKHAQKTLIESEKMAALGSLVAGVAHEINTPLGVTITALSHNHDSLLDLEKMLTNKTLKQSDLEKAILAQNQGYTMALKNLDRANFLISNFKRVAVDQSSEQKRKINLTEYINEIYDSLKPLFSASKHRNKNITVDINGPGNIIVITYPGALFQILSNFVENSLKHGFEGKEVGNIVITISQSTSHLKINYSDNGVGMSAAMLKQVYDPFITSKRNDGGSGLGMHIVYNLVTQLFNGEINCYSEQGKGIEVNFIFPKIKEQ